MKRKIDRDWKPYPARKVIKSGGIKILKTLIQGTRKATRIYRIRFLCCNKEQAMSHKTIDRRISRGTVLCLDCSKKEWGKTLGKQAKGKRSTNKLSYTELYGVWCPSQRVWPVPASVITKMKEGHRDAIA